ncbi:MAG: c-type cytochrome [Phycisphaeraceae bacterium]|nr:c-type cytochrome [Phycisphaeraceae bacterium]MCW5761818.1 c-type cytochrome [Phycisphaeraceae bacterium]
MMQDTPAAPVDHLELFRSSDLRIHNPQGGDWLHQLFFRGAAQTEEAVRTDGLFMLTLWFSVFFFVLLMGLMFYWVIKYRRRPGVPAPVSASHNGPLEIFWTVVPSSGLLVIFLLGFQGYMAKIVAPTNALTLNVTGLKWDWIITYPNGARSGYSTALGTKDSVKIFVLPEDTDVKLLMQSRDVIHAFWVPDYRTKIDLYPNRLTSYTFRTEKLREGEEYRDHWIFCAEYCGDQHSEMYGIFRVVSNKVYNDVLNDWSTGNLSPVELGQVVFRNNCISCHSIDGSPNIGPSWLNAYGYERAISGGTSVLIDENYIRESILNPQAKIVAGYEGKIMTAFAGILSDDEINGVIAYYKTLSDKGPAPEEEVESADPEPTEDGQ